MCFFLRIRSKGFSLNPFHFAWNWSGGFDIWSTIRHYLSLYSCVFLRLKLNPPPFLRLRVSLRRHRFKIDPVVLEKTIIDPVVLEKTIIGPVVLEKTIIDPVVLEKTIIDPVVLETGSHWEDLYLLVLNPSCVVSSRSSTSLHVLG